MTIRPEYASSTTPESSPTFFWRAAANVSVFFDTIFVTAIDSSDDTKKIVASSALYTYIMINDPMTDPTAVSSVNTPRCSTSDILSRSFVARLTMSPGLLESKNASGRRLSFSAMRLRSVRLSFSAKPAIVKLCTEYTTHAAIQMPK